jgi:hypothetical protein
MRTGVRLALPATATTVPKPLEQKPGACRFCELLKTGYHGVLSRCPLGHAAHPVDTPTDSVLTADASAAVVAPPAPAPLVRDATFPLCNFVLPFLRRQESHALHTVSSCLHYSVSRFPFPEVCMHFLVSMGLCMYECIAIAAISAACLFILCVSEHVRWRCASGARCTCTRPRHGR